MKPLRLEIQAFGPYREREVVDFAELGLNRVFLIQGDTGAGKTTILDAMVFALYGATSGGERSPDQMRCDSASANVLTEVVFDFSLGERQFRVKRRPTQEVAGVRGAALVSKPAEVTIWERTGCGDTDEGKPLATKIREADERIKELLGFSCEQFRQVVVLPQGRFRELLSAGSDKREEILRQLFRTERFRELEWVLVDRAKAVRKQMEQLELERKWQLGNIGAEDDAGLAALTEQAMAELEVASRESAGLAAAAEAKGEALKVAEKAGEAHLAVLQARLDVQQLDAQSDLVAATRERIERARRADKVQPAWQKLTEATTAREQAEERARDAEVALAKAVQASAEAQMLFEHIDKDLAEWRDRLRAAELASAQVDAARARLEQAMQAADRCQRFLAARAKIKSEGERLEACTQAEAAMLAGLRQAESEERECEQRWKAGRAGSLAATLQPGQPCPVCGSTDHPAPAPASAGGARDDDLEACRAASLGARKKFYAESQQATECKAALEAARQLMDSVAKEPGQGKDLTPEVAAIEVKARRDELHSLEEQAEAESLRASQDEAEGKVAADHAKVAAEAAKDDRVRAEAAVGSATNALQAAKEGEARAGEGFRAALDSCHFAAMEEWQGSLCSEDGLAKLEAEVADHQAKRQNAMGRLEQAEKSAQGQPEPADVQQLREAAEEAGLQRTKAIERQSVAKARLQSLEDTAVRLADIDDRAEEVRRAYEVAGVLAETAEGKNAGRVSFQRWVLGVYLDEVLAAASRRLYAMSKGRYQLERQREAAGHGRASGLDLNVFDEFSGASRPAVTLSGGESFLAALALALGLAETVQEHAAGIPLETIFVDEGFGALDADALELAVDALMELQSSGRLVGVISHVPELKLVIPARLEVRGGTGGSRARFVVP